MIMSTKLNDIWDIISDLKPEERRILYKRLHEDIRFKMNEILDKVNERSEEDNISIDEITEEVESVRGTKNGEN